MRPHSRSRDVTGSAGFARYGFMELASEGDALRAHPVDNYRRPAVYAIGDSSAFGGLQPTEGCR